MKKDLSISNGQANLYSFLMLVPVTGLLLIYIAVWSSKNITFSLHPRELIVALIVLVIGTVCHEFLHGISWAYFGKKPLSAIKLGIFWRSLNPYAHSTEPMDIWAYRLGGMMPGVVLGILPSFVGILTGASGILFFGLIFTLAAGGDALVLWLIRGVKPGTLVEDHPTRAGCFVYEDYPT